MVTDEFADPAEAKQVYGIELVEYESFQDVDAVILAVGHDRYKTLTVEDWQNILIENGVMMDVKAIYHKDFFSSGAVRHWRL